MSHSVREPLVMSGTGRCGSTLLFRILAMHPQVGWLSPWNEVFPRQRWLSAFSSLYRIPQLGQRVRHEKWFPKPYEAYRYWESMLPGFSRRDRPQVAADVPESAIAPVRRAVASVLRFQGRSRFLVKVTGWARMEYFQRIFPDARFLVMQRELRSVVSSWVQADWLDTTSAPTSPEWQWGPVPAAYRQAWEELGRSRILSAAVKIQLDLDDLRANAARFPEQTLEVQYEQLLADPVEQLRAITAHCHLPWTSTFEAYVRSLPLHDTREKWRQHLSSADAEAVSEFFRRAAAAAAGIRSAV